MNDFKKGVAGVVLAVSVAGGGSVAIDQTQRAIPVECELTKAPVEKLDKVLREYKVDEGFLKSRAMTSKDRANIKSCEIKKEVTPHIAKRGAYRIQIVEIEPIEGGVQVFARAWKGQKQIGFGEDGTVDIERFRIFNPPVLVDDPNGDIIITSSHEDPQTLQQVDTERRLREDPEEALIQTIEHNLSVMQQLHTDENIVSGKRGNTTTTFYPSAGDGWVGHFNGTTWADDWGATTADTGQLNHTLTEGDGVNIHGVNYHIRRALFPFDTSILGSDVVLSATFSVYVYTQSRAGTFADGVNVFQTAQASASSLTPADYNQANWSASAGATELPTRTTAGYLDFPLNATGLSWIDNAGVTKLGVRLKNDYTNTAITSGTGNNIYQYLRYSEYTGTTNDTKLVVEHTAGGGGAERRIIFTQ